MRHKLRLATFLVLLWGCDSGTEPDDVDPFAGRWLLTSVNAQPLPASGPTISPGFPAPDLVTAGRLTIFGFGGFPHFDCCTQDPEDGYRTLRGPDELRYLSGDDTEAELMTVFPLSAAIDTIRLAGDVLTWEYNQRSDPNSGVATDLLRFRLLADGEAEGPVCAL